MLDGCLSCCRGPSKHKVVPKLFCACPGLDAASSLAIDTWQYQLVAHGPDSPLKNSILLKVGQNNRTMEPPLFKVYSLKRMTQPGAKSCLPLSFVLPRLLGPPVALAGVARLGVTSVMVVHQPCPKSPITPRSKYDGL